MKFHSAFDGVHTLGIFIVFIYNDNGGDDDDVTFSLYEKVFTLTICI